MLNRIKGLYIVGGWVRDRLLGLIAKDMDLASPNTPDEIIALFKQAPGWSVKVTNAKHLVVTIVSPSNETWEHTTFRRESEMDGVEATCTPIRSLMEDLNRRDFTVNAMAQRLSGEQEVVGVPFALEDLENRVLRLVESDEYGTARERLEQSANRFFRAARFMVRGFTPDPKTLKVLQEFTPDVLKWGNIEAFQDEWSKTKFCQEFLKNLELFGFFTLTGESFTHKSVDPRTNLFFQLEREDERDFVEEFRFPNKIKRQISDLKVASGLTTVADWIIFQPKIFPKETLAEIFNFKLEVPPNLPTQAQVAQEGFKGREIKIEWERRVRELLVKGD